MLVMGVVLFAVAGPFHGAPVGRSKTGAALTMRSPSSSSPAQKTPQQHPLRRTAGNCNGEVPRPARKKPRKSPLLGMADGRRGYGTAASPKDATTVSLAQD